MVCRFVEHEQVGLHHEQSSEMGPHDPSAGHRSSRSVEVAFAEGQSGKDTLGFRLKVVTVQLDISRDGFMMLVRAFIRVFAQRLLHFDEAFGNCHGQLKNGFVAAGCAFLRKEAQTDSPRKRDSACIRRDFTKNERKERGLARPVGSDQANAVARINLQRRVLEKNASRV